MGIRGGSWFFLGLAAQQRFGVTVEGVGQMAQGLGGAAQLLQAGAHVLLQRGIAGEQLASVGVGAAGFDNGVTHIAAGQAVEAFDQALGFVDGAAEARR